MDTLLFINDLRQLLWEVERGMGNPAFHIAPDHRLLKRLRDSAWQKATENQTTIDLRRSSFYDDLADRARFARRVRYCLIVLHDFSIPASRHQELIEAALLQHPALASGTGHTRRSQLHAGEAMTTTEFLISKLQNCFSDGYYPTDIQQYDFAEEHQLITFDYAGDRWRLTSFGRYLLPLSNFDAVKFILALEIVFGRTNQRAYLTTDTLDSLLGATEDRFRPSFRAPFYLRKLGLISESRQSHNKAIPTEFGIELLQSLQRDLPLLKEIILFLQESESIGFETAHQANLYDRVIDMTRESTRLPAALKDSLATAVMLIKTGRYNDGLTLFFTNMEGAINIALQQIGVTNEEVQQMRGMQAKVNRLETEGILSSKLGTWAIITMGRNKFTHGNMLDDDATILAPVFDVVGQMWLKLLAELETALQTDART